MKYNIDTIKQEYIKAFDNFSNNNTNIKDTVDFYSNGSYKIVMKIMNKVLKKMRNGRNKKYIESIESTMGDYSKRKGGNIYQQMKQHATFIENHIKTKNTNIQYSFLGIYVDLWNVLNNKSWTNVFMKAYSYSKSTGEPNTLLSNLKLLYIASVLAFETISFKVLDYEYHCFSGKTDEEAVNLIMSTHTSFMKYLCIPAISLIAMFKNTSKPEALAVFLTNCEKENKKYSEGRESVKSEEGLLADAVSYARKILGILNSKIPNNIKMIFTITASAIALIFLILWASRLIIYWVNSLSIDMQKRLELESELLDNNILELKEKLEKTKDPEERVRIQNIISKQIEILNKINKLLNKKLIEEENNASTTTDNDVSSDTSDVDNDIEKDSDDDFEIDI